MTTALRAALAAALFIAGQSAPDDPVAALRALPPEKAESDGRKILLEGLEQTVQNAFRALDEGRLSDFETQLLRAAHLSHPYHADHARRLAQLVIAVRHEARSEGISLVRDVTADLARNRPADARQRIDEALKSALVGKEFRDLVERLESWKSAPKPDALEAEIARWRAACPAGVRPACEACRTLGEADCSTCEDGVADFPCRACGGKGQAPCGLCGGPGSLPHGGYSGRVELTIDRDTRAQDSQGRSGTLIAQTLIWNLKPCNGKGTVELNSESRPKNPRAKASPPGTHFMNCPEVFEELRLFVFSGKARVDVVDPTDVSNRTRLTVEAAKRLFADYEKCAAGRIPCDRCVGQKTEPCGACGARGTRSGPCGECFGLAVKLCATCGMTGDTSWLDRLLPINMLPGLNDALGRHGFEVTRWYQNRHQHRTKLAEARTRYEELRRTLDPTAKVKEGVVNLPCGKCKGKGKTGAKDCGDCWGTGRREYYEGTPQYALYAEAKKLQDQIAQLAAGSAGAAPMLRVVDVSTPGAVAKGDEKPPAPPPDEGPSRTRERGSGIGGEESSLPQDLQDFIAKADAAYQQGKQHYSAADGLQGDAQTEELKKALQKFKEAQTNYTTVQEQLDERGLDIPKSLMEKIRTNLQALVMARKKIP